MLKQHEFYVYHAENKVLARMGDKAPVVALECKTAQEAHDEVQKIVNPKGLTPAHFKVKDDKGKVVSDLGFHDPRFQSEISGNCKAFVLKAYGG